MLTWLKGALLYSLFTTKAYNNKVWKNNEKSHLEILWPRLVLVNSYKIVFSE